MAPRTKSRRHPQKFKVGRPFEPAVAPTKARGHRGPKKNAASSGGRPRQARTANQPERNEPQTAQNPSTQRHSRQRVNKHTPDRAQSGRKKSAKPRSERKSIEERERVAQPLLEKQLKFEWRLGDRFNTIDDRVDSIPTIVNNLETPTLLSTRAVRAEFNSYWHEKEIPGKPGEPVQKKPGKKQDVLQRLQKREEILPRLQRGEIVGEILEEEEAIYLEIGKQFCEKVFAERRKLDEEEKIRSRDGDLKIPDAPPPKPSKKSEQQPEAVVPWACASKTDCDLGEIILQDYSDDVLIPGPRYGRIQDHLGRPFPPIIAPNTIEPAYYNQGFIPNNDWPSLGAVPHQNHPPPVSNQNYPPPVPNQSRPPPVSDQNHPHPVPNQNYPNLELITNNWPSLPPNNAYVPGPRPPLVADAMGSTPTLIRFLNEINSIVQRGDGTQLKEYLLIEPPFNDTYIAMIKELRQVYPRILSGNAKDLQAQESQLNMKCGAALPVASVGKDGATWGAFVNFIVQYLKFIRDVDVHNLLETYDMLTELVEKTNSALTHNTFGALMIPTALAYSKVLARLAVGLDKQPELIAHIPKIYNEDGSFESLPERAANTLRKLFVTCLNDRSPLEGGRPVGKKAVIYTIANICLKVLFACRKVPSAEQIFNNIVNQSPPLSLYSASERVTYLYYLGRFHFATGHYYRAALALQSAFDQTPSYYTQQRRRILIYLVTSNLILGRFPSSSCYALPEAKGFREKFYPITDAIRKGNIEKFRRLTSLEHLDDPDIKPEPHAKWLYNHSILLQIRRCCEVHVQRSLLRRLLMLVGDPGVHTANEQRAANINLNDYLHVLRWFEVRSLRNPSQLAYEPPGKRNINHIFHAAEGRAWEDFDEIRWKADRFVHPDLLPDPDYAPPNGYNKHVAIPSTLNKPVLPTILEAEAIVAALITQGFVSGYMKHRSKLLVISGAKREGGALKHGFPRPWTAISERSDKSVPGWRMDDEVSNPFGNGAGALAAKYGPGMVVNLSGVKPVGM